MRACAPGLKRPRAREPGAGTTRAGALVPKGRTSELPSRRALRRIMYRSIPYRFDIDRPACRARFSCGGSRPVKRPAGIASADFCGRGEDECGRFKLFGSRARRPAPPSSRDSARKSAGSPVHPARRRDRPPPRPESPRRRCGWHRGNPQRRPFPPAPL